MRYSLSILSAFDLGKRLFKRWDIRDRLAHSAPLFDSLGINEYSGPQGDVLAFSSPGMEEPVFTNHLGAGVGENGEFPARVLVPYIMRMFLVVHADGDDFYFSLLQLFRMLRQTAQLNHAERSPVAAVEVQENPISTLGGQGEGSSVLVPQAEIGSWLAGGRLNLRFGISPLCYREIRAQKTCSGHPQ
jgi:hypothetical protein